MKESGINYFYNAMGLDTGSFLIFYTFENGTGSNISSISGGQSMFNASLSAINGFWSVSGSGFFSGNQATINNASGLYSNSWTKIFVYEKTSTDPIVLFNSAGNDGNNNYSGYTIGVNSANKPYMASYNGGMVVATSNNNLSSKNAIILSYLTNYLTIGYYNVNNQSIEYETFNYPFQISRSDNWSLGYSMTGFFDYFLYLGTYLSTTTASQLLSGLFFYPTGIGYTIESSVFTGITGFQAVVVTQTGVTGYIITPGGDIGRDYYTGTFPTYNSQLFLTGILNTGIYISGVSGEIVITSTGSPYPLYLILSGYASSFGMEKIQSLRYVSSGDIVKDAYSYILFDNNYNFIGTFSNSGNYLVNNYYDTGIIDLFYNGVAQANIGWIITGQYITQNGAQSTDSLFYDTKTGDKKSFIVTTGVSGFSFTYSGQELYLNGVNLISGYDFNISATGINLTTINTGITGYIFEYPTVLQYNTGMWSIKTGQKFMRNTSNIYLNGIRQLNYFDYIEGSKIDKLSGNYFNINTCINLYNNTDQYWE